MNATRIAGIVLILAGGLSLAYGGFTYTKETHKATIGPVELAMKDQRSVDIPPWAGVLAIVLGGVLAFGVIGKR